MMLYVCSVSPRDAQLRRASLLPLVAVVLQCRRQVVVNGNINFNGRSRLLSTASGPPAAAASALNAMNYERSDAPVLHRRKLSKLFSAARRASGPTSQAVAGRRRVVIGTVANYTRRLHTRSDIIEPISRCHSPAT